MTVKERDRSACDDCDIFSRHNDSNDSRGGVGMPLCERAREGEERKEREREREENQFEKIDRERSSEIERVTSGIGLYSRRIPFGKS